MSSELVLHSYDTACQSAALQNKIATRNLFWLFLTLNRFVEDFCYFTSCNIQSKEVAYHAIVRKKEKGRSSF